MLSMLADQNAEFEKFRDNVADRLGRLERGSRRRSVDWLDPENLFTVVAVGLAAVLAIRLAFYFMAQIRARETT